MNNTSNTITPVYFPFTFISDELLQGIATFWREVIVYQPSGITPPASLQPWIDKGVLKTRNSLQDVNGVSRLRQALRSCQSWGEMHHGSDIAYLKAANAFNKIDPGILDDLKGYISPSQTASSERPHEGFAARLFLHLAQEYDQKKYEVVGGIQEFENNQQFLNTVLHPFSGEDDLPETVKRVAGPVITSEEEPQAFMMGRRMQAWNCLFQQDGSDTDFLFTDSREALALLLGQEYEKFEILRCRPHAPFAFYALFFELMTEQWSEATREKVNNATRDSAMAEGQSRVLLRCYLVPDQSARVFLSKTCSTESSVLPASPQSDTRQRNALIGLLERGW